VHSEKLAAVQVDADVDDDWAVVQAATNIAGEARSLPWTAVLSQLEGLKVVVGIMDPWWLD
jgi:hypothetical protein